MTIFEVFLSLISVFLIPPFILVLLVVLLTAAVGRSFGIREIYVKLLIKLFEFGKTRLAAKEQQAAKSDTDTDSSEDEVVPADDEGEGEDVIHRDVVLRPCSTQPCPPLSPTVPFHLADPFEYLRTGMEAIVDDEVTKRFSAEELKTWNLLTRTTYRHQFVSVRLTIAWVLGFVARYFILLPMRTAILLVGMGYMVLGTYTLGRLPEGRMKAWMAHKGFLSAFRILARCFSNVVRYHGVEHRPRSDGICVANHTSPIDCVVLAQDCTYSFVGQCHGGFLGLLQRALSRASSHIWFERGEAKDRTAVAGRLRDHVNDPTKMPILIFPEGTCINNTSVMQFKKGTFEVGGTIYPVAIKYDPRFGDAFWNSSEYGMLSYLFMMMTSWAIVCDVWYLPPMTRQGGEDGVMFANRVKAEIARQGGLVDLIWDGGLKRSAPKKEWREVYQQEYSRRLRLVSMAGGVLAGGDVLAGEELCGEEVELSCGVERHRVEQSVVLEKESDEAVVDGRLKAE